MPFLNLRGLILLAIASILILRTVRRWSANKSNQVNALPGMPSSQNRFCTNCGAPLQSTGMFCGGCGARRN